MTVLQISQGLQTLNNTISTGLANLGESKAIDAIVGQILSKTQALALLLGVCFYLLMLGFNYLKSGINKFTNHGDHFFIDLNELTRTIGLLFLIGSYPIIMGAVAQFVNVSYSMTKMSGNEYQTMINISDSINSQYARQTIDPKLSRAQYAMYHCNKNDNPKIFTPSICAMAQSTINDASNKGPIPVDADKTGLFEIGKKIKNAFIDAVNSLYAALFLFMIQAIKMVIYGITKLWLKILYVTGPLALAFAILPFFRRQGEVWFGYFLNTCFVFVTFNILDCIFFGILANQIGADQAVNLNSSAVNVANTIYSQNTITMYYIILIIAYLSAFRITSYYVGHAEAGRAVGKAVSFVADLAMIGFTGGATSAAGSSNAKLGESMAKGAKGIKDNED